MVYHYVTSVPFNLQVTDMTKLAIYKQMAGSYRTTDRLGLWGHVTIYRTCDGWRAMSFAGVIIFTGRTLAAVVAELSQFATGAL